MDLVSVAEGVETEEQAARLRELGVQLLQGYHFSRPLPAHALKAWLEAAPLDAVR
jgi:EAL domain-containing protein (putative c-di-GMP-specific phosphodiesterase class I)